MFEKLVCALCSPLGSRYGFCGLDVWYSSHRLLSLAKYQCLHRTSGGVWCLGISTDPPTTHLLPPLQTLAPEDIGQCSAKPSLTGHWVGWFYYWLLRGCSFVAERISARLWMRDLFLAYMYVHTYVRMYESVMLQECLVVFTKNFFVHPVYAG